MSGTAQSLCRALPPNSGNSGYTPNPHHGEGAFFLAERYGDTALCPAGH